MNRTSVPGNVAPSKSLKSLLEVPIPPTEAILNEVRKVVAEPTIRINVLSALASQDVCIVLELIRMANSLQFAAGRPPATTMKASMERLGAGVTIEVLDKLREISQLDEQSGASQLLIAKKRCYRSSQVARALSEVVAKNLADDCEVAGLLYHIGEVLAVVNFKSEFVKLATELPRVKLLYRLEKDHKFDPQKMGIQYLRKLGIPEAILFGIDPEAQSKTPGRGQMKLICQAASEMVLAYESEKWDKLAPGNPIPPKSPIRLLGLNDNQYAALYEKVSGALG